MRRLLAAACLVMLSDCTPGSEPSSPLAPEAGSALAPTRIDLGTLGGFISSPGDINSSGAVVGISDDAAQLIHPFLWTAQTGMRDLGIPPGDMLALAHGMNDHNDVVGESISHLESRHP